MFITRQKTNWNVDANCFAYSNGSQCEKKLHNQRIEIGEATEYNSFTDETWRRIQSLILSHVCIIQVYFIEKKATINPHVINTNVVESFFGNARSTVGGSTNKLRAKAANAASRKAGAFNRGKHGVLGNNKSGEDTVLKRKANRFNA